MTPAEYKQIEGQRVQAVITAVGALPAAGILTLKADAAPLFALATVSIAAAYMFWLYTDAAYYYSGSKSLVEPGIQSLMARKGKQWSLTTLLYGVMSLSMTMAGFVAHHSKIRLPITIGQGFALDAVLFFAIFAHVVVGHFGRNKIASAVIEALDKAKTTKLQTEAATIGDHPAVQKTPRTSAPLTAPKLEGG